MVTTNMVTTNMVTTNMVTTNMVTTNMVTTNMVTTNMVTTWSVTTTWSVQFAAMKTKSITSAAKSSVSVVEPSSIFHWISAQNTDGSVPIQDPVVIPVDAAFQ